MRSILILLFGLLYLSGFGQKYWQQEVNYTIEVALDDEQHILTGVEEIEYINNSPYALKIIFFHLWPNAYKNNHTAFARQKVRDGSDEFYYAPREQRGWIDSLQFKVDGERVNIIPDSQYIDVVKMVLNKPLIPGEKIIITTPFTVKLPKTFSRLGHIGQSYQITQWYPKPAVFDRYGWHPMPYLDQGEFYSEYGSFDVKITVPENYVVGATGVLHNEEEKQWLNDRVHVEVLETQVIPSSTKSKTLRYTQDKIHDFAWFADKNYMVKKGEVTLPETGKKVETWYMYTSRFNKSVEKAMQDLHDATYFYSKFVGDYPYSAVTAVTGALGAGGGMEYPMITVTLPNAIIHEVGHNWFYGILGTNERAFGWMDEGLNSYFENETYMAQSKRDSAKTNTAEKDKSSAIQLALSGSPKVFSEAVETRNVHQPVHHHSNGYHSMNYFIQLYQKPVILMRYLRDYLGDDVFDKCFHAYYKEWQFKHPYIENMQAVFERESGKDLEWMFRSIIKNNVTPEVRILTLVKNKRGVDVLLESKTRTPVKVDILTADNTYIKSQWVAFKRETANAYFANAEHVKINDDHIIFKSQRSKFSRSSGPLKQYKLPTFNLLIPKTKINRANIAYVPTIGVNHVDGLMAGMAFYNTGIRSRKINYTLNPMYGTASGQWVGIATANMYFYPNRDFQVVETGALFQKFQLYERYNGHISLWSKPELFDVSWNQKVTLSHSTVVRGDDALNVTDFTYDFTHKDAVRKVAFIPKIGLNTTGLGFTKASVLTSVELRGSYEYMRNTRIKGRFFAGTYSGLEDSTHYFFGLSNGVDYHHQFYAYERGGVGTGFGSWQSNGQDGGFKAFDYVNAESIVSFNGSVGIPKIPMSIYYDVARADRNLYWGTGLTFHIIDEYAEIYFPLLGTHLENPSSIDIGKTIGGIRFLIKIPLKSSNEVIWSNL